MHESEFCFHLLYILLTFCIIYPPPEFVSAGLTINYIIQNWIESELIQFIQFHIKRTSITLLIHSLLPFFYILFYSLKFWDPNDFDTNLKLNLWYIITFFASLLPILSLIVIWIWSRNNWENHPICKCLKKFTNNNARWETIAADINIEYRRNEKMVIKVNSIFTVIATENWVMKTTPYIVNFAHQSDTALIVDKSDSHLIGTETSEAVQFVNIQVKPTRTGAQHFSIRINALDYKDLQDRISRPITILSSVQFHQTVLDRWIQVFKEQISLNPKYILQNNQQLDTCFACMTSVPNIKLQKHCVDVNMNGEIIPESDRCSNCYCSPMWCDNCMAKWFASRQNQFERDVWLQQKCTCPMCRAKFCILDISYLERDS